jgi:HlyD family secretion protein
MRSFLKWLLICLGCGALVLLAVAAARSYWQKRNRVEYYTAEVVRGDITSVVNATGEVQPVKRVQVGSFVSGPIEELNVDFNDKVGEGEILAKIDRRLYVATRDRDKASLEHARAEVERVRALFDQANNDYQRALALSDENPEYISDTEIDSYKYNMLAFRAQVKVAEASVKQAEASLENSETNVGYTDIKSPVDGIVIERKVDQGQTVAAQFQTPDLFIVAPDLEKEIYVYASVDEADMGLIRDAQESKQPVLFTVDAYPDDLFEGRIYQVRMNSQNTQNVVTYPVVVTAANADLKLLPGMTANLSFQIEKREDVVKIPNGALRFYPKSEQVRPEDRTLLDAAERQDGEQAVDTDSFRSAADRVLSRRERDRRHVWVREGELLKAIEVRTGLSDYKYSELLSGELKEGQPLVTGVK